MSTIVALTSSQKLIFAIVILILVVVLVYDWIRTMQDQPRLPHRTRQLMKELERHKEDE